MKKTNNNNKEKINNNKEKINKKRNKQELTDDEIRYFIQKYTKLFLGVDKIHQRLSENTSKMIAL